MPGGIETSGIDQLSEMLGNLGENTERIASGALFEGAAVMADAYRAAAGSIVTGARRYHSEPGGRLPTPAEKAAVQNVGIAHFRHEGGAEVDTVIGMPEGYANVNGHRKAIKLIARSINSGTSFMQKQPVFRRAFRSAAGPAQAAMVAKADELIGKLTK